MWTKRPGPCWRPRFSPHGRWWNVSASAVQTSLIETFRRWGLPQRLRVDNGIPWGTWSDLPSDLALWLIGLGIHVVWNRPCHPQENGRVERSHGVLQQWVEPQTCPTVGALEERLEQASRRQREAYPSVEGRSRLAAYPSLASCPRPYDDTEWDLARVCDFLSQGRWRRRVGKMGQISLYNHRYQAGRALASQIEWVLLNDRGEEVIRHLARELTVETIQSLNVMRRKPPRSEKETT